MISVTAAVTAAQQMRARRRARRAQQVMTKRRARRALYDVVGQIETALIALCRVQATTERARLLMRLCQLEAGRAELAPLTRRDGAGEQRRRHEIAKVYWLASTAEGGPAMAAAVEAGAGAGEIAVWVELATTVDRARRHDLLEDLAVMVTGRVGEHAGQVLRDIALTEMALHGRYARLDERRP